MTQKIMTKVYWPFMVLALILITNTLAEDCDQTTGGGSGGGTGAETGPSSVTCTDGGLCTNQNDDTILKDPNSSGYIVCQCGCQINMPCPAGLEFNMTNYRCDWGPNSGSVVDCRDGLVYNVTSQQCDWPPGYDQNTGNTNVVCDNDVTLCQGVDDGTLIVVNGVCNQFYKCSFGCAVVKDCPADLVYNPSLLMCVYPWDYSCPWPYTPPSGPGVGPSGMDCPSGGRCVGVRNGMFFPSTTSCNQYVVCDCECEVPMDCPEGLQFNTNLNVCDYPDNVKCTIGSGSDSGNNALPC